jgi:glycosyltransferase involved in cell wall biosynthesis
MRRELGARDVLALAELVLLMRRRRPHIVHASSSKAGVLGRVAAWLTRVPIRLFTAHGWAFNAYAGARSRLYELAERIVRPLATLTICVSESERDAGLAARTCEAERAVVIRTGIDATAFAVARPGEGTPAIVAVGRLRAPKDPVSLVRALALLRGPFRATLVGSGPDEDALEDELSRAGLTGSVLLAGERDDVPEILASSAIFVLSSRAEALPVSVLEAMAAGLPVVATRVGGVPEVVVDGETGLLVPPGDPPALAVALQRLLDEPELRARLGTAGRARVEEQFGLDSFLESHLDLYRRALAARGLPLPSP